MLILLTLPNGLSSHDGESIPPSVFWSQTFGDDLDTDSGKSGGEVERRLEEPHSSLLYKTSF